MTFRARRGIPDRAPDLSPAPRLDVDRVLELADDYDLHSRHNIGDRDLAVVARWLPGAHPLFGALFRLRGKRITKRKELYETAFVLERLHGELRRARVLVDLGAGHGLVGLFALLLHPHLDYVLLVDKREPPCFDRVRELLAARYPFLKVRSRFVHRPLAELARVPRGVFVVGVHCCGPLTDHVARLARAAAVPFAVVPCCESRRLLPHDLQPRKVFHGSRIPALVNERRLARWREWGYEVDERSLPTAVTERPRLLVAAPRPGLAPLPWPLPSSAP